jgi:hypothetical protein
LFRLLRLLKLLRILRMGRIFERWEEDMLEVRRQLKMVKICGTMLISCHWVTCLWFHVGTAETRTYGDGSEQTGWVLLNYKDWTKVSKAHLYYDTYFFSWQVMLTAGADPTLPDGLRTSAEKFVYMLSYLVGALVFSMIIGQIGDIVAHANPGDTARADRVGMVQAFMVDRNVHPTLVRRVRSFFMRLYIDRGTTMDVADIFEGMPHKLQIELGQELRFIDNSETGTRSIFSKVVFLQDLSSADMVRVGCKLVYTTAYPPIDRDEHAFIMTEGDREPEMWILVEGIVQVERAIADGGVEDLGKLRVPSLRRNYHDQNSS